MRMFRSINRVVVSALVAHAFAWTAGAFLAFAPLYSGYSSGGETHTSTLIEVNGSWGVFVLSVPILLTGLVLRHVWQDDAGIALPWIVALVLVILCFLAIFSVGIFYVPAAIALGLTAVLNSGN